jgi:hypothetical protein
MKHDAKQTVWGRKQKFSEGFLIMCELGSSVSIVSGYGLGGRVIAVRSPAEAKGFFSLVSCFQTGSEAHRASCTVGTGVFSSGLKCGRGVTLTTHLHAMPRSRMSRSYTSPPSAFVACSGTALALFPIMYAFSIAHCFIKDAVLKTEMPDLCGSHF